MACKALPGITSIYLVEQGEVTPYVTAKALTGAKPVINITIIEIPFDGEPTCETETDFDNNSRIEKVKLRFDTLYQIPLGAPWCFCITTANGEQFLIGTYEKPYPIIKQERKTGTPDGDAAVLSYTVSFTAKMALVPVTVEEL